MKAFVIACTAFAVLLISLFGSSAWLTRRARALSEVADALPTLALEERSEEIEAFSERWERERLLFIVFIHKEELVPLEGALTRARAAAKIKSDSDYLIAVAELRAELVHLQTQLGVHWEGIF